MCLKLIKCTISAGTWTFVDTAVNISLLDRLILDRYYANINDDGD